MKVQTILHICNNLATQIIRVARPKQKAAGRLIRKQETKENETGKKSVTQGKRNREIIVLL